jgi:hypothetical protein
VALLGLGLALPSATPAGAQAIIDNGVVQLGVNREGHLNLDGGTPTPQTGTTVVGLRYIPTNSEGTSPGCLCEGWGAADATSGITGYANISTDAGANFITPISFSVSGAGTKPESVARSAESVVTIGGILRVTQNYHPSVSPNLYEVTVTIQNISGATVSPRYRRTMDFDVEPTAFSEFMTIEIGTAANLIDASDNGFSTANPLGGGVTDIGSCGPPSYTDCGPTDHGAVFDFGFDPLAPGAAVTFQIYYGAAGTELAALAALSAVGAEVYALGQPAGGQETGAPNTFIFGFSGVGGVPVLPQCELSPASSINPVGTVHTVTATVTLNGAPVPANGIDFDVVAGPHIGATGSGTTNLSGQASFSYTGTIVGTDTIEATGSVGDQPFLCRASKQWVPASDTTPPFCQVAALRSGPPAQLDIKVQDTGSGLASIVVLVSENSNTPIPPFTVGTNAALIITSTKINQSLRSRVELRVTDVAGNVTECDPVLTLTTREEGQPVTETIPGIPRAEDKVTINNGFPGFKNLEIEVNGTKFKVHGLKDGQQVTIDVSSAMLDGNSNVFVLRATGKPGSWANVMIWDGIGSP